MKGLVITVAIVLLLLLIGWLQFSTPDGDPTIRIDTDKVEQDTSAVVDKAKEAAREVDRRVDVKIDTSREPVSE